jgi:hypothetical protein
VDPKRIAAILADLANATDADLRAALAALKSAGVELAAEPANADNNAKLSELVTQRRAFAAEITVRAERAANFAELDGVHDPATDNIPQPDAANTSDVPKPGETPAVETPAAAAAETGGETPPAADATAEGGASAAEGDAAKFTGRRRAGNLGALSNGTPAEQATAGTVAVATRVRGGVPGMEFGTQLDTASFMKAFTEKANAQGGLGRQDVARVEFTYPENRVLGDDPIANTQRISQAKGPDAITAAGGLCLPLEVRYDIPVIGVTDRPVRDALTRFGVTRGGIQYRAPFDALAMTSGLGVWTQADDQAVVIPPPDPDTNVYKSCMTVDCPGVLNASIYSTYLCLEFPNMTARFDTEWVDATTRSSMVAWARFAENQLLSRVAAGSKIMTGVGPVLSAVADILATYDRVISYYRSRHRLNSSVALHTIAPQWLIDMLRTDLARRMTNGDPGVLFGIAQSEIEGWFRTRNVNVTWHLDGLDGATVSGITYPNQYYADTTAGQKVPKWPTAVDTILYVEGDWLFLDGGTLDLGLVRDSQLNRRNRYQTFVETFEGVAFDGKESLRIVMPLKALASAAGTTAPADWDAT